MKDELMWVEKYRPRKIAEIVGNEEAKASFVDWLKSNRWRKKPALLYGPPGVGKTALVHAAANEFNFNIIEMNASDTRTEKSISKIAGPATTLVALDKFSAETEGSLLFLDEVDGIFGREDRGGIGAITDIFKKGKKRKKRKEKEVQESQIPVVLAANDLSSKKLRPLRRVCHLIRFRKVRIPIILALLQKICHREHIAAEFEALEKIAQKSEGDVRSAINDLQALCAETKVLSLEDTLMLSLRGRDYNMQDTLRGIFSAKSFGEAMTILNTSNVDFDLLVLSIHDNLPLQCKDPVELGIAYDLLSRADVFRGRIGNENWRLLKYFINLLAQSTTVASQTFRSFEFIFPPMRISTLFWTKGKRMTLETICAKIGARCHVSRKSAKLDFVPFLKAILRKEKASPIYAWLQLDSDEIKYLTKIRQL